MQKIKNRGPKKTNLPHPPDRRSTETKSNAGERKQAEKVTSNKTYSAVTNGRNENYQNDKYQKTTEIEKETEQTLQMILQELKKLNERVTFLEYRAQGAIPKVRNG
uniref:Uncharacterized protein LOC114331656 n=1 Tax=Diabrotica virgifera virgifera TaxID=50390 RepID=A0A6P7FW02_DIAVI